MCGIAGLFDARELLADAALRADVLGRMTGSMTHRGPDAGGDWHDAKGRCSLGHRRLSIIDTSEAGTQPMTSADGRWVIAFNGEIYNFLEIRPQLETAGGHIAGRTDTEVLLQAIAVWGPAGALARLDGMFAFAAFDRASGEIVLARDPFGEKPLYYAPLPAGGFAFASELQALEVVPGIDHAVSVDAVAELLMFQYVSAPRSIYRAVRKLPPGHWMRARPGEAPIVERFFAFRPGRDEPDNRPIGELADELEAILERGLRRRLISDVPLGAFLSGGLDSSTVCALIRRRLGVPLKTFSIGFEGADESEHEVAREFARHLGTDHHEKVLAPASSDFLLQIGGVLDEPNADSSCLPTFLLAAFARQHVTVALSGDGGDEMFGGYGRYFHTLAEAANGAGPGWHAGRAYYSDRILVYLEEHVESLLGEVPHGTVAHLRALRQAMNDRSIPLLDRMRQTDVDNYMPGAVLSKVDRMSMQHSLEVRTPFLNVELARFAERLPESALYSNGRGKLVLREIAYRHLPRHLVDLPKKGFGLPMSRWGRELLLNTASKLLESDDSRLRDALGSGTIARFMTQQRGRGFSTYQVWGLAMLESWLRHHPGRLPKLAPQTPDAAHGREVRGGPVMPPAAGSPSEPIVALRLYGKVFAVIRTPASDTPSIRFEASRFEPFSDEVGNIPALLAVTSGNVAVDPSSAIPLDTAPIGSLDGATLLLLDPWLSQTLTAESFARLRRAGVTRLGFAHPFRGDGSTCWIAIHAKSPLRHLFDTLRLARHGCGWWRFLRAHRRGGSLAFGTSAIPTLPQGEEAELSHRYMLFEGLRQLPPLPVPHTLIDAEGSGRYSIWGGTAIFSASGRGLHRLLPRWVIENNVLTQPRLQYAPQMVRHGGSSPCNPPGRETPTTFPDGLDGDLPREPPARETLTTFLEEFDDRMRRDDPPPAVGGGRPLRIVVLTHALPPGGAERQWCYLAIALKRLGHEVMFVTINRLSGHDAHYLPLLAKAQLQVRELADETLQDLLRSHSASYADWRLASMRAGPFGQKLAALYALLEELHPDAVIAQLDQPNLLAGTAAVLASVPRVVLSFRNYNPTNFPYLDNPWFLPLYRSLARSERVVFSGNARGANDDYADWIGIPRTRVHFVANSLEAVDLDVPGPEALAALRTALGIVSDTPVLLGVFRLSVEKRPTLFVDVCAELAQRMPGLRVLVAGIGPLHRETAEHVRARGLESVVTLLGRRTDVGALMSIASVLLLTSTLEGMPNVVMEAQVLGLPVVATDTGGVRDCVVAGKTALLVDAADPYAYVEATARLLGNVGERARFAAAAREWAAQRFVHARMADGYVAAVTSGAAYPASPPRAPAVTVSIPAGTPGEAPSAEFTSGQS